MLQVSPDNGTQGWDWCSGYHYSDSTTIGFSHLHLSGTGIGDLADIRFMPINKKVNIAKAVKTRDDIPYKSNYTHNQESAEAGYYSVFLKDHNIKVELTSDLRTAFHQYTFAKNDMQSIIIDLGYAFNWDKPEQTQIKIEDKFTVSGYRHSSGWAKNQKVFFAAKFSKSIKEFDLVSDETYINEESSVTGSKTTAQLHFNDLSEEQLKVKVGVSSVSVKNALENISENKETFNAAKQKASKNWNKSLSKIDVESSNDSLKTIFYTALYHSLIAPVTFSDANGEFRMENDSLLTVLEPDRVADIINSMLAYYGHKKRLPVWTLYGNETNTMTGYHSIPVIAEAYFKGIKGFDIRKAYDAMKTTMMQDDRGLSHYKKFGYIPFNLMDESVTITLEFA